MSTIKLVCLLVVALCALQGTGVAGSLPRANKGLVDDALEWAKQTIADWVAGVEQMVADEVAKLQGMIDALVDKAKQIIWDATADLREAVENIKRIIKEAEEEAAAVGGGTDISACITGQQERAEAIVTETLTDITACLTDKITEAQALVAEIVSLGQDAVALGPKTLAKIDACFDKRDETKLVVTCIYDEVDAFLAEGDRIITTIKADVAKAQQLISTLDTELVTCANTRVDEALAKIDQLGKDIVLCVAGMLIPGGKQE